MSKTISGKVHMKRSSVFNIQTNLLALLVYVVSAVFAFIPVVGFFAWLIPLIVFFVEKNSNFVRFCASQSFCIGLLRMVFDVVFGSIASLAKQTALEYSTNATYLAFWGSLSSPGSLATTFKIIFAVILTVYCVFLGYQAYKRKIIRVPLIAPIAQYMTTEIKVDTHE